MFKKSLWFGSIVLVLIALFALNGCSSEDDSSSPAVVEEDPALQGDLGGIRPGAPVHNASALTVITGTNARARIDWGEGVSGGSFQYDDGNPVKAGAVVTANANYIFDQTLNETDILTAFTNVTRDIDDDWTLSEDYTELSFTFSYTVAQAELDLSPLKDIKLVAGSANMPAFIDEDIVANLDPDTPPVNAYVSAATPEAPLGTNLPAANTGFKVRVEASAAYGYKWPANFDYAGVYESAAKVTPRVTGSVLTLTLEYDSGLIVISAISSGLTGNILPLFENPVLGGYGVPVKLLLGTGTAAPNFTVEKDLEWSGLAENRSVASASKSISTPVTLIPNDGYTFSESALTEAAIALAINATTYNHKVEGVKKDHNLAFTLTYPVTAVQINTDGTAATGDMALDQISANKLSDFYQPRIDQPVYTKLEAHPAAKFTVDSVVWSNETGNVPITVYDDMVIRASITLKAKDGYTFSKVNIPAFATTLTANFTKDTGKVPEVRVVGTPDETLIFTLTYTRDKINPPIITGSGSNVVADGGVLNAGGGLAEIFDVITGSTVTIPKTTTTITLTTPPVVPAGKTLALDTGAAVTTTQKLEAAGNITIGTGGNLTASGGSDISGNVTLGANSILALSGTSATNTTISGNVTFGQSSELTLGGTGSTSTIGSPTGAATTLAGPTGAGVPPAPIDLTAGTLELKGNVTATNVKITSEDNTKINIPTGVLNLGTGASLVLTTSDVDPGNQGGSGILTGRVVVQNGGAFIDTNVNTGAWHLASGGEIEIQYGGTAVRYESSLGGAFVLVGIGTAGSAAYSNYVQLAEGARFTIKEGELEVTEGEITLGSNFALAEKVTVKGELILNANVVFLDPFFTAKPLDQRLVGTTNTSTLTIKSGKTIIVGYATDQTGAEAQLPGFSDITGLTAGSSSPYGFSNASSTDITLTWNPETNKWE
jgi:hypothetical protein